MSTEYTNVTDRQTPHDYRPRLCIASHGKTMPDFANAAAVIKKHKTPYFTKLLARLQWMDLLTYLIYGVTSRV